VNVADLWKFTPLHEAAAKGKYEIVRLLLRHGADSTKKNRDGATPLDLVRDGDQDVADLLRGNSALLDAAKKGNLARVQRLITQDNINCRDAQGRNSTPLHLAGNISLLNTINIISFLFLKICLNSFFIFFLIIFCFVLAQICKMCYYMCNILIQTFKNQIEILYIYIKIF